MLCHWESSSKYFLKMKKQIKASSFDKKCCIYVVLWAKSFRDIRKLKLLIQWNTRKKKKKKFLASRIIKKIFMIDESFNNSSRIQFMILIKHPHTRFFFFLSFCAIQDSRDDPIKSEWNFSTLSRDISDINNPRIRGKNSQSRRSRVIWYL